MNVIDFPIDSKKSFSIFLKENNTKIFIWNNNRQMQS